MMVIWKIEPMLNGKEKKVFAAGKFMAIAEPDDNGEMKLTLVRNNFQTIELFPTFEDAERFVIEKYGEWDDS